MMNDKLLRTAAALLSVLTVTGLFAACGGGGGETASGTTPSADGTASAQTTGEETVTETTVYTPDARRVRPVHPVA